MSITIPETVTTIGIEVFNFCTGLKSVTLSDIAAKKWHRGFISLMNLHEINVQHPGLLPDEVRPIAMAGYARHPDEGDTERKAEHIKYIKANAAKLMERALECPELLRLMLEERLLMKNTAEKYLAAAVERKLMEAATMLLEYLDSKRASAKNEWKL